MKKKNLSKIAVAGCATALAFALAGCSANPLGASSGEASKTDTQAENRAYMSSVNQAITTLDDRLEAFEEAVSRGDVVSMKTKAAKASEVVSELEAISAPESLKDVHESYVEGCKNLEEALSSYVDLYAEAKSGKVSSFEAKLKQIQKKYDEGIAKLKEGDTAAAAKGTDESEESKEKKA